jgi:superfamily II DNA or RNA helicase
VFHSQLSREERNQNLSRFRSGEIPFLLAIEMLNEGIDVPEVNLVAFMRVTHSRRIFVQQLGRGLRLSPGKDEVIVLDFVADVRRLAAAVQLNHEARVRSREREVLRYRDGRVVKFSDAAAETFFDSYIADVAAVESLDDGARLRFPDPAELGV